jgi:hypothetical protein
VKPAETGRPPAAAPGGNQAEKSHGLFASTGRGTYLAIWIFRQTTLNSWTERLKRIRRFVLAVDDDAPGKRLADELIRRLLASR